jgi:osmotically-inducible protein OsmY
MKRLLLGMGIGTGIAYGWRRLSGQQDQPQPSWIGTDNDPEDVMRAGSPDDATIVDRVRSEAFRDARLTPGTVNVNAEYGKVVLRGEVESEDLIRDLVERVRQVDGVVDVENQLTARGEARPSS